MQVLIVIALASFVSTAFGSGEFNAKTQLHSRALAKAREAIQKAGTAELRFNELLRSCKPESIKDQAALLNCGSQFSSASDELGKLKFDLASARSSALSLPPEFAPSKAALIQGLDQGSALIDASSEAARKLSLAFFAGNEKLVIDQFTNAGRSQYVKTKTNLFCADFQMNLDRQVHIARASLEQNLSFGTLYVMSYRIQNILRVAPIVADVCRKPLNLTDLTKDSKSLQERLTDDGFRSFRKESCQRVSSSSCENVSLTPYSVYWLIAEGSRR
jgi:hypothetical protein